MTDKWMHGRGLRERRGWGGRQKRLTDIGKERGCEEEKERKAVRQTRGEAKVREDRGGRRHR